MILVLLQVLENLVCFFFPRRARFWDIIINKTDKGLLSQSLYSDGKMDIKIVIMSDGNDLTK